MALFRCTLAVVAIPLMLVGCDELIGSKTYDDCILRNLRGVTNNSVAVQIQQSCQQKFPEKSDPQTKTRELAPWEVAAITGRAGLSYNNRYSGSLYNGNKEITVTQVEIQVKTKDGGKDVVRAYTAHMTIPPLTAKDFSIDIIVSDKGSDYSWGVNGARGY